MVVRVRLHNDAITTDKGDADAYAPLIYRAEEVMEHWSEADLEEALTRHGSLQEKVKANSAFLLANELTPRGTATRVKRRAGKTTILDGPFAETKEQLVGLYVFDCKNLDVAIE